MYAERKNIFFITGYSPKIQIPNTYKNDIYLAPRSSSWGWATWRGRWEKADWACDTFHSFRNAPNKRKEFLKGGDDLWPMLIKQRLGVIDSWSIRWTYTHFIHQASGVYPTISKVRNIGTDGTGTNFSFKTTYYDSELNSAPIKLDTCPQPDYILLSRFKKYYDLPIAVKIKNAIIYHI